MSGRAKAFRIMTFGATLTPFGRHETYDDPGGLREATPVRMFGGQ